MTKTLMVFKMLKVSLNFIIMLKSISNLGKALNKTEQQSINGGAGPHLICPFGSHGAACIVLPTGQIGQCNRLGVCEC